MTKTIKIYLFVLVLLFAGAIAIEFSKPRPIDWNKTYNETHKIPYGTYIFYNELEHLFPTSRVQSIQVSPYEYFDDYYDYEDGSYLTTGTYMYIDELMTVDQFSAQELLDFASQGNDIFISSSYLPELLMDSLKLKTTNDFSFRGSADLYFANPQFRRDSISIDRGLNNIYFSEVDSVSTTVLGYQRFLIDERINFVKVKYKLGSFYIHLQPIVFTNYNLLKKSNKKYTAAVVSYLSDDTIYFDSRDKSRDALSNSPLRFIFSKPALKWAWILSLLALIVFVIFNAKRKQRVVKVIKPLENTTVAFTKTIGNLYYETKDHNNIIDKKITYFLEYIRRVYYLNTEILDDKFVKHLSLKSGRKIGTIKKLINTIAHLKAKAFCTEEDLLNLNRAIEDFHKK